MIFISPKSTYTINSVLTLEELQYQSTLVELLQYRAIHQSEKKAYTFLKNGESELITLTYGELDLEARKIAAKLQSLNMVGERALLLYNPGIEFISAFFGCLYAGVIGVPLYPPKRNQNLSRIQSIINNCSAKLALTTQDISETVEKHFDNTPELAKLQWLTTDNDRGSLELTWEKPEITSDSLAFLQYTSGSTGNPKGVMVTHGNLLHNEQMVEVAFGHTKQTIFVGWLPLFHDMGLIGNVLQPLHLGIPCILMSPVDFLQKPYRWLQAISQYRATTSGGPNFAYDLCIHKVTPEQMETLDLTSWEVAFTGAEPIRAETLEKFTEKFAACGFRKEVFYPCYGMAEATLFISGGLKSQAPVFQTIEEQALEENQVICASVEQPETRTLVGCGREWLEQKILIVNPQSLRECEPNTVGEIWVSGGSIAKGYWEQQQKTEETFNAYVADTQEGPFLRTGDLGFLGEDGELFVTGRLKDVIIVRGRNHYPQDIELTLEQNCRELISHRSAAFTINLDGQEKLVVVAEVERRYHDRRQKSSAVPLAEEKRKLRDRRDQYSIDHGFTLELSEQPVFEVIVNKIKQAVAAHHGLQVYRVLLLRVGTIPKTSSGKIQRHACRRGSIEGTLNVVYDSNT
ncbi:fatty acyl-AMP ligase [Aphanothece sacrum]|nr:fatty acyl-AMP ligase [Aphanothece sacrum]